MIFLTVFVLCLVATIKSAPQPKTFLIDTNDAATVMVGGDDSLGLDTEDNAVMGKDDSSNPILDNRRSTSSSPLALCCRWKKEGKMADFHRGGCSWVEKQKKKC